MDNREPERRQDRSAAPDSSKAAHSVRPEATGQEQGGIPGEKGEPDEEALFGGGQDPALFGEGSYGSGGAPNQGNYEVRETNPHGGLGRFNDAGGYGGTELLGEETPIGGRAEAPPQDSGREERQDAAPGAAEERRGKVDRR